MKKQYLSITDKIPSLFLAVIFLSSMTALANDKGGAASQMIDDLSDAYFKYNALKEKLLQPPSIQTILDGADWQNGGLSPGLYANSPVTMEMKNNGKVAAQYIKEAYPDDGEISVLISRVAKTGVTDQGSYGMYPTEEYAFNNEKISGTAKTVADRLERDGSDIISVKVKGRKVSPGGKVVLGKAFSALMNLGVPVTVGIIAFTAMKPGVSHANVLTAADFQRKKPMEEPAAVTLVPAPQAQREAQ